LVKQVFFDFFGTLVDYDPSVHPPAHNAALAFARRAGSTLGAEAVDALWQRAWDQLEAGAAGTGREFSMHDVAQQFWWSLGAPAVSSQATETLIADYLDAWTTSVSPAPGALECVADLAVDHRLAVVSNTHDAALVPRLLRRTGLHAAIDRIFTSVTIGWRKPHPMIFAAALRESGVAAADVVFVGDNWQADVEGPRAAGMAAIYVGRRAEGRPSVTMEGLPQIVRSLA
jgi:putative hydrolase of the HAD superfamily